MSAAAAESAAGTELVGALEATDLDFERHAVARTLETLPSGETGGWSNPQSGHAGSVTPLTTYRATSGEFCREFRETVSTDAETREGRRIGCRLLDGSWKIVRGE